MLLSAFHPQSRLVTKTTLVKRPRVDVVDAHYHLADPFGGGWDRKPLTQLLELLDEAAASPTACSKLMMSASAIASKIHPHKGVGVCMASIFLTTCSTRSIRPMLDASYPRKKAHD